MGNRYSCDNTFGNWCLSYNRQDILDLWDYDLNNCSPFDIPRGTKNKYYFKCHNGIHESDLRRISNITESPNHKVVCKLCGVEGLLKKDLTGEVFGELTVLYLDKEKSNNKYRINYYVCQCSCGNIISVDEYKLINGKKISCGKAGKHKLSDEEKSIADLRNTREYYQFRKEVLYRNDFRCIITGERCDELDIHHIYPFRDYPKDRFDPNNGVCLSKKYHFVGSPGSFHNIYGVYNNTPEQIEEYINIKRKELGITDHFDVYEYMSSYDDDNQEIDELIFD